MADLEGKSKVTKLEEVKSSKVLSAIAEVRAEVDKLEERVAALETIVYNGITIEEKEFTALVELLMRQVLKLDGIEADGEEKVQRKLEVRRVQSLVDSVDFLRGKNINPFGNSSKTVSVTTKCETFDSGMGCHSASPLGMIQEALGRTSSLLVAPESDSGAWISRVVSGDGSDRSSGVEISAAADEGKESEGEFESLGGVAKHNFDVTPDQLVLVVGTNGVQIAPANRDLPLACSWPQGQGTIADREVRDGLTIIRADGLVQVIDPSGNETVLNPEQILSLVGVDVQERLLPIFQRRPETFLRVPELSTCFAFYFLSGLDRILNFLEDRTVGGVTNDGIFEIRRLVNDCKMGLRIDWIEGPLLEILNIRNAQANLAQVESRIHELRDTLSRLEREKSTLAARVRGPLVDPSTGEIDLEMTLAKAVQRIEQGG